MYVSIPLCAAVFIVIGASVSSRLILYLFSSTNAFRDDTTWGQRPAPGDYFPTGHRYKYYWLYYRCNTDARKIRIEINFIRIIIFPGAVLRLYAVDLLHADGRPANVSTKRRRE